MMDFELEDNRSFRSRIRRLKCKSDKRTVIKWTVFVALFLAIVILVGWSIHVGWLHALLEWVSSVGYWGNAFFILLFCFISLPYVLGGYSVLALACGFLYGPIKGFATLSISSLIGCMFGYWVTRFFGQKCLGDNFANSNRVMKVILAALQADSFKIMVLCRLTPIPYGVQNAIFAIAKVNFFKYVAAEFFLYIPTQLALAYVGSTAKKLSEVASGKRPLSKPEIGLLVGEILAGVLFIIIGTILGKKAHAKIQAEGEKRLAQQELDETEEDPTKMVPLDIEDEETEKDMQQQEPN